MKFFENIAHWFIPWAQQFPFLKPLTEPGTIILVFVIGGIAIIYYITGSWLGGRSHHDDDDDYY